MTTNAREAEKTREAAKTEEGDKEEKDTAMVAVQVPIEFKNKLDEIAKSRSVTVARLVRNIVSENVGFDLTSFESRVRTRSSKFATDEERNAAKKANAQKRADVLKALMAKYKSGEITL